LAEVLLHPNAENGQFDPATVDKEKRVLKQRLQAVYDDKMRYANMRLIEAMCKDEPYALQANGIKEEVDHITPQSLYAYYQKAVQEDELDLYVTGDVDEDQLVSFCKTLTFGNRAPRMASPHTLKKVVEIQKIKEAQDIKQAKLNIGYRTNIVFGDDDYFALQMFNGIFGGFSHSKLFINVREKASLCYYVASQIESHKGLMMVMSGIETDNYDQAVSIIEKQLEAMKNGDFSEEEMAQTKAVIRNQLLETTDTSRGMVEILYHNVISKQNIGVGDWLHEIEAIEKGQILKVAAKIEPDTIYFLSGLEGK
jgi:predicted Zn-dependent peptidase